MCRCHMPYCSSAPAACSTVRLLHSTCAFCQPIALAVANHALLKTNHTVNNLCYMQVERLGFPVKATPQHLLQSLQLPSQQPRQQQQQHEVSPGSPPAKTTSSATVHFVSPSREGDKRLPARLSLPGQLLAQQRSSSPPAAKLQVCLSKPLYTTCTACF